MIECAATNARKPGTMFFTLQCGAWREVNDVELGHFFEANPPGNGKLEPLSRL